MKKIEKQENAKNIEEIIDYSMCPIIHLLKHKYKVEVDSGSIHDKYSFAISEIIKQFYYRVKAKEPIRTEDIKRLWGKAWVLDKRKSKMVFSDTRVGKDAYNNKRLEGLTTLLDYRKHLEDNPCFPIVVKYPYSLKLEGCTITGEIDVLKEVGDDVEGKEIRICTFMVDAYNTQIETSHNLRLNASYLAAREMIGDDSIPIVKSIYNLSRQKEYLKKVDTINKEVMIHSLETISKLIDNEVYYMTTGVKCKICPYRKQCKKLKNIPTGM